MEVETVDISTFRVSYLKLAGVIFSLLAIALPWVMMGNRFVVPEDVQQAQKGWLTVLENYRQDPERWNYEKDLWLDRMRQPVDERKKTLRFSELPMEVIAAYLHTNLPVAADPTFSIYPSEEEGGRFLLIKKEAFLPFLSSYVSLEVEVPEQSGLQADFVRLRRGADQLPVQLAWTIFGEELIMAKELEPFLGRFYSLSVVSESALSVQLRPRAVQ